MGSVQAVFGLCSASGSCGNCPGPVPGLWGRRSSAQHPASLCSASKRFPGTLLVTLEPELLSAVLALLSV